MQAILSAQQRHFATGITRDIAYRKRQLRKLRDGMIRDEAAILAALKADLNKSEVEAYGTELGYCLSSIRFTLKRLSNWAKLKRVSSSFMAFPSLSYVQMEPVGNVLIIGPFNYPFQLIMEPLIGALSAGNTAVLKPSEHAKATAAVIEKLIADVFEPGLVSVVHGDASVTQALAEMPFNHIFFTGSTRVGKAIYASASKHLTPVTLELGGKSPTIIDETADLRFAAKRIAFGKFINAGQTCIAPDHVYVHAAVKDAFVEAMNAVLSKHNHQPDHFPRIIHEGHFDRLVKLIEPHQVVHHGGMDAATRYLGPHVIENVSEKDAVMQEEIFGPILPILTYTDLDALIEHLKTKDKPLALYLFSQRRAHQRQVFDAISFGNGAINDTLMQVANPHLPFGGIGASGIGAYHGYASFERFSHRKAFIKRFRFVDLPLMYPPYSATAKKLIKAILR
jgi:aldehyde dehydrogenase (NAD+)